jgi:hypothetical protein
MQSGDISKTKAKCPAAERIIQKDGWRGWINGNTGTTVATVAIKLDSETSTLLVFPKTADVYIAFSNTDASDPIDADSYELIGTVNHSIVVPEGLRSLASKKAPVYVHFKAVSTDTIVKYVEQ